MEGILKGITWAAVVATIVAVAAAIRTLREEKRVTALGALLALALALVMLPVHMALSGARLAPALAWIGLGLGAPLGFVRGATVRLRWQSGQVMGRHSLLLVAVWGLSWAVAQAVNTLGSTLAASAALLPVCVSTGGEAGMQCNLLVRRIWMRRPRALPFVDHAALAARSAGQAASAGAPTLHCARCGAALGPLDRFCGKCGAATGQ